jgi:hypothetical protein
MAYKCRDCGNLITVSKPVNTCPSCGSLYLIPDGYRPEKNRKRSLSITLSERFVSLVLGFFAGLLTFFIWGIAILIHGGPAPAKAAAGAFYFGVKLSLYVAIAMSVIGFVFGERKLLKLLGIIWGTDKEFFDKLQIELPLWLVYPVLIIVIIGAYGYLFVAL